MIKGIEILWKEVGKDLEQGQLSTITTVWSQRKIPEAFPTKKTDWVKPPPAAQVGMALHNPVSHHTVPPWPPCFYCWPATVSISTELPSCQAASNYIILVSLNERALPNIKHFLTPLLSQTERSNMYMLWHKHFWCSTPSHRQHGKVSLPLQGPRLTLGSRPRQCFFLLQVKTLCFSWILAHQGLLPVCGQKSVRNNFNHKT